MRASSITLLLATGLWAVAACSGGGDPSGQAAPLENGSYQKPFSSYEPAPSTPTPTDYERPPSIYEPPGTPAAPGGGGEELCKNFCGVADANECSSDPDYEDDLIGQPYDECLASCTLSTTDTPCTSELDALFSCIFANTEVSCRDLRDLEHGNLDDLDEAAAEACNGPIQPLVNCLENQDPPDPGEGSCTLPDQCSGCRDACERCRCENLGDDGPCTDCRNQN